MGIMLNPLIRLRRDRGRILVYRVDPVLRLVERQGFIPPLSAILLSLFDGSRDHEEVLSDFSFLLTDDDTAADVGEVALPGPGNGDGTQPGDEDDEAYFRVQDGGRIPRRVGTIANSILRSVRKVFGNDLLETVNGSGPRVDMDAVDYVMDPAEVNIAAGDGRLVAPLELNYIVTHACPRRCLYCYAETYLAPRLNLLPLPRIAEIAAEAGRLKVNAMYLSGGDPFARKDILEIVRLLIENRVPPFLSTKSHLKGDTCERLRELGVEYMQVSLDASEEGLADEMTGSEGSHRQILETLDNLARVGIRVRLKAVVTARNVASVPALLEFAVGRGIRAMQLSGYGRSVYRHDDDLFTTNEQLEQLSQEVRRFQEEHPELRLLLSNVQPRPEMTPERKRRTWEGRSACSAGRTAMTFLPDGKVTICDQLPSDPTYYLGDLSHQSILEVWNGEAVRRFLQPDREDLKGTACYNCPDFEECHRLRSRCLRDVFNVFRNPNNPDPACPRAGVDVRI